MNPIPRVLLIILVIISLSSMQTLSAQPQNALSFGFGDHFVNNAFGLECIGFNPAILGSGSNPAVALFLPAVTSAGRVYSRDLQVGYLLPLLRDPGSLSRTERNDIIYQVPARSTRIYGGYNSSLLSFSFPTSQLKLAVSLNGIGGSDTEFNRSFARLILRDDHPSSDIGKYKEETYTALQLGMTIAKNFQFVEDVPWLDEMTTGFTFSLYQGLYYRKIVNFESIYHQDGNGNYYDGQFDKIQSSGSNGSGTGLDFGLAGKSMHGNLRFGISLVNLLSSIEWTGLRWEIFSFRQNHQSGRSPVGLDDWFTSEEVELDSLISDEIDYERTLPSYVIGSLACSFNPEITIGTGLRYALTTTPGEFAGLAWSLGGEWRRFNHFPLQGSLQLRHNERPRYGLGIGFHYGSFRFNAAAAFQGGLFGEARGLSLGVETLILLKK